ncbi:MAG: replicative DNA helicase [Gammaproteobacteria bacterium]|nr:replicative DNA helicase [Gammaproteobacteria bacterium]
MAEFRSRKEFSEARRGAPEPDILRIPPHSIEAEQSVLGGLMLDNQGWDKVSEAIVEADFYRHDHRLIFRAMAGLAAQSKPVDFITVSEFLELEGELDEAGGLAYLAELAKNTPSAANILTYAEIVRERAVVRDMIGVANEIADSGFRPQGRNSADLLDEAESKVFKIAESRDKKGQGPRDLKSILGTTLDRIDELVAHGGSITGLTTGFSDLDKMTSGLQAQDLVIVAARPSMGKTTFSMNLVENAALASGKPVLVYSMEMPSESIMMRTLSSISRVDQTRIRTGQLDDEDWNKLTVAINKLSSQAKIFIDDSPGLSPTEVRSRARRIAREHGDIGMIMVDYLQLMQVPGMSENRTQEISEISRSLKSLAKELNCPVIALSQLNRSLEQRADKRPVMSDLRESGAIEQDADIIMFIYRDEVYNPETPDKGTGEIIIAKQRNGPIGKVRLTFQGKYTRFDNFTSGEGIEGGW